MYLIRRAYKVKPGTTKQAAEILQKIGIAYQKAGQRSETRVYWSGYTVPGPANTVYMDWIQEILDSPYREQNVIPDMSELGSQLREVTEESSIEFYEMIQSRT